MISQLIKKVACIVDCFPSSSNKIVVVFEYLGMTSSPIAVINLQTICKKKVRSRKCNKDIPYNTMAKKKQGQKDKKKEFTEHYTEI